jgi:hypothetical protein
MISAMRFPACAWSVAASNPKSSSCGISKERIASLHHVEGEPARKAIFRLRLSRVVSLVVSAETKRLPA